jgi:hypothetical protein
MALPPSRPQEDTMQTQTQVATQFTNQELHQIVCLVGRYIKTLEERLDSENDTKTLKTYINEITVIKKKASQIRREKQEVFFSLLAQQAEGK